MKKESRSIVELLPKAQDDERARRGGGAVETLIDVTVATGDAGWRRMQAVHVDESRSTAAARS